MTTLFFDTSALLKRYVDEPDSDWLRTLIESAQGLLITSTLTRVEAACALARRERDGALSPTMRAELWHAFQFDLTYLLHTIKVGPNLLTMAEQLAFRHPLRAYDAIQLATAQVANQRLLGRGISGLLFLSADTRLLEFARLEGLAVDNPLAH